MPTETLEQFIAKHKANKEKAVEFIDYLYELMRKYGYDNKPSDLYNKANITKQTWSKLIGGEFSPSLNTCLKIVFALGLDNHECKYLLKKAGYTLASSSTQALIIRYCVENKLDVYTLDEYLSAYGFPLIG